MKVPLTGSAYTSRSVIASAQRCVNLYSEHNPEDSPFPATYYQTPGIKQIATATPSVAGRGWRFLYTSTLGVLYGVLCNTLYSIASDFTMTNLGVIGSTTGNVSMVDNGVYLLIVDGSSSGWFLTLAGNAFAQIGVAQNFYGANRVDLVDGFFVLNRPNSNQWYISGFLSNTFDPLDFAAKTGFSDQMIAVGVAKRQVFLLGTQTTECWYNSGGTNFTFSRMPGVFIHFGCAAPSSVCQMDGSLYWLASSPQGDCMVMRTEGYERARMSTFAIEKEFQGYPTVSDASAYTYQQEGHMFYVINFPSANKTWAFDAATKEWHERAWLDSNGHENRQRQCCHALFNGWNIVGDWQNGNLYKMDQNVYNDNGAPIRRLRSFPHLVNDGSRVMYSTLVADMEAGNGTVIDGSPPELRLRWSDTRGLSWGSHISQDLGARGEFLSSIQFQRLGMARDRVFELSWSGDCKTALSGAYLTVTPASS